ncbi:MAG: enoyl-CoA hydratase-related protein [Caulobacteraceae bacterium]
MTCEHIRAEKADGVLTLTFARPAKKNALTDAMYGALADEMAAAEDDPDVRVILLAGEGADFTAGNDIADFLAQNAAGGRGEPQVARYLRALATAKIPLVAAVTGHAVGIGLTMLLHCDLVYVAKDARLSAPFVNLAVVPEAASSILLPAVIGHRRAFSMFALGETISGETAVEWGVANAAFGASEVLEKATATARSLAAKPVGAVAATKRLMRDPEVLLPRIELETRYFSAQLMSEEARQALSAFFAGRN